MSAFLGLIDLLCEIVSYGYICPALRHRWAIYINMRSIEEGDRKSVV